MFLVPHELIQRVVWRVDRVRFWDVIARGAKTDDAAIEARVSRPVAFRWSRHASRPTVAFSGYEEQVWLGRYGAIRVSGLVRLK